MGQSFDANININAAAPTIVSSPVGVRAGKRKKVRVRVRRLPAIEQFRTTTVLIVLISVFLAASVTLIVQRTVINRLDERIDALSTEYDNIKSTNDDLRLKIMFARNIGQIEAYARDTLGMVKSDADDYECYSYPQLPAAPAPTEDTGFFSGLLDNIKNLL